MKIFKKITIILLCSSILKALAIENIPPVVVTKPYTSPVKVITQNEISAFGVNSLSDALKSLGGLQLQDTTGNGSQVAISMRGFGSNASSNTLLLINGIPFTNPDIAPPDLNNIPIEEVERIEIFSGSASVLYGDQAVGGVVNVITKKYIQDKVNLSCALGSFHTYQCDLGWQRQWKKIQFAMNLKNQTTDNYREHNNYYQTNLNGSILYPYSSGSVELIYQIEKEKMLYPGALSREEVDQDPRAANNDTDFFADTNGFIHLKQMQALNDVWNVQTNIMRRMMSGNGVLFSPFTQSRVIDFIQPELQGKIGKVALQGGIDFEN
ncbi:MAG TPA: TonB-dependent receptor plug domain-containing protein, partial [Gammaproteobacteria bacterium]|nr:TonB-dependent receptor plug domain-containing protein [Gammaproteobacteria bacterium]